MRFDCEDLPQHGVVLVPPSAPEFDALRADIERRAAQPVDGSPPWPDAMRPQIVEEDADTSAILLNRSSRSIAGMQLIWKFEETSGRSYTSSMAYFIGGQSVLLPFNLPDRMLKHLAYWNVILPGSKRYVSVDGSMVGDNSDVRPPGPGEVWTGGRGAGGGGGQRRSQGEFRKTVLTIDGVFFDDGGFAGPNRRGLFEQIVAQSEAHLRVAAIATERHHSGSSSKEILTAVEAVTGPGIERPSPHPGLVRTSEGMRQVDLDAVRCREWALSRLAWLIGTTRGMQGDERVVQMMLAWNSHRGPHLRRI